MFLLHIFERVIFPVFVVIALGYLYARLHTVDVRPFAKVAWNLTGPCLAFASLVKTTIPDDDFARIVMFVVLMTLILWPLSILAARMLRLDRQTSSAFQLGVLFGNVVNYGFPVLLFAFGEGGVERGIVFMTGNQIMLSTLAVFIASRGRASLRESATNILKVPMLYASIAGFAVNRLAITIPAPVFNPIKLLGEINVMFMLLILGMQLAQVKLSDGRVAIGVAAGMRLLGGAALGVLLAGPLGMHGLTRQAAIVEAGVPTAVYSAIIAAEYDVAPSFAAATVFVSTLLSMGTLTIVLALLGVR
jgi:predicted permease